jgi:hypothetical protein
MANDITTAVSGVAINNKRAICSTLPTGQTSKLVVRPNFPVNLTIENIESKFDNRFYNGVFVELTGSNQIIVGG